MRSCAARWFTSRNPPRTATRMKLPWICRQGAPVNSGDGAANGMRDDAEDECDACDADDEAPGNNATVSPCAAGRASGESDDAAAESGDSDGTGVSGASGVPEGGAKTNAGAVPDAEADAAPPASDGGRDDVPASPSSSVGAAMMPRRAARSACDSAQNTRASLRKRISRLVGCTLTSISAGAMDRNNAATGWRPGGTTS